MNKKIGIIINPIAGIGGMAGFKGSDGEDILNSALKLGYRSKSSERASLALKSLVEIKDKLDFYSYPGDMGENQLKELGISPIVLGSLSGERTRPEDTRNAAKQMKDKVDLILFAGGDGTARDIYSSVGEDVPVLGIPTGVKIHSAVYGINPRNTGIVARDFLEGKIEKTKLAEVMDIDEDLFRRGEVNAKLFGYMYVPVEDKRVQNMKSGGHSEEGNLAAMAGEVVSNMEEDVLYIIGPGTTPQSVMDDIGLKNTLLGIDVIKNKKLIASDVNENELWNLIQGEKCKIVMTIIGGQGHLFGRGNQQISPRIIRYVGKENLIVMATKSKMISLYGSPIIVDTGNIALDKELSGFIKIVIDFAEHTIYKVHA